MPLYLYAAFQVSHISYGTKARKLYLSVTVTLAIIFILECPWCVQVVRESNVGDGGLVKPIEIPPPRPKRKPMHPYPRKLVSPVKTGILIPEKPDRSTGQENQSPTSVLSALGSDQSVGADSCMPNGSPSPVSSALARNTSNVFSSEAPKLLSEDVISSQSDREDENSSTDEEIPLVLA